jgi:hypothetical protein
MRVHSSDTRKPAIKAALLRAAGVATGKVTDITESKEGVFAGSVLVKQRGERSWRRLGTFTALRSDLGQ